MSPFTLELRLSFAIPLAIHNLHPRLLTHADTFSVSIICHSVLAFGVSMALNALPPFLLFLLQSSTVLLRCTSS